MRWAAIVMLLVCRGTWADDRLRTMVLPLESLSGPSRAWIGQAVQKALLADLQTSRTLAPLAGAQATSDPDAAARIALASGARYVVFGSVQAVEGDIRAVGQVWDVLLKRNAGAFKATASQRDLFGLQESVAAQVRQAIGPRPAAAAPEPRPGFNPAVDRAFANVEAADREVDRILERLRDMEKAERPGPPPLPPMNDYYYPPFGVYSYPSVYVPGVSAGHSYSTGSNLSVNGSYTGKNLNINFGLNSGNISQGGNSTTQGNYIQSPPGVMGRPGK